MLVFIIVLFRDVKYHPLRNKLIPLGFFYAIMGILDLTWSLGFIPLDNDPISKPLLTTVFLFGQAVILVFILSGISKNKNLKYLLVMFVFTTLALRYGFDDFFVLVNFTSYLLIMLAFLYLKGSPWLNRASIYGSVFSTFSMTIIIFSLFTTLNLSILGSLNMIFLMLAMYDVHLHFKHSLLVEKEHKKSEILSIFKIVLSLVIVLVLSIVAVISLHELGHAVVANFFGCTINKAVIYDGLNMPHTELSCDNNANGLIILMSGLIVPLLLGLVLLLLGDELLLELSYLILGFSFYFATHDLKQAGLGQSFILVINLLSFFFMFLGIRGLVKHFFDEWG